MEDLYETLGVERDADAAEIKRAGRRRQKQTHPDAGGDQEAFVRVTRAVAILSDPVKRSRYDRDGTVDERSDEAADRAEATQIVTTAMLEAMERDPKTTNLPQVIASVIREKMAHHARLKAEHEADAARHFVKMDAFLSRLKKTGAGPDRLREILDAQRRSLKEGLAYQRANTERAMTILQMALVMVEGYEYETDPAPPSPFGAEYETTLIDQMMRAKFGPSGPGKGGFWR